MRTASGSSRCGASTSAPASSAIPTESSCTGLSGSERELDGGRPLAAGVEIEIDAPARRPVVLDLAVLEPDRALADPRDGAEVVADEEHRPPLLGELRHLSEAPALELGVADREHLVDDDDVGLDVRRDREGEAQVLAGRVALDGRLEQLLDAGELDDVVEAPADVRALQPEDGAVQEDVLAPVQLRMEAGSDLEQRTDAAAHPRHAAASAR